MKYGTVINHAFLLLIALLCCQSILQAGCMTSNSSTSKPIEGFLVDGPYVFYKKGKVFVKSLKLINNSYKVIIDEYDSIDDIKSLSCEMDSKAKLIFDIKLRKEHKPPPSIYEAPEKLFAISDIEGNFGAFVRSLRGNGVIDTEFNWSYGKGHLVLNGDFFDRGVNVTACLWLIYKLEQQAEDAGGMVHFIIGNHEEMNLRGDMRYVRNKYRMVAKKFNVPYKQLYSKHTELGRWLRSKNVIERIGKTIFVHGGLSPRLSNNNLHFAEINKVARSYYGTDKWKIKEKGGIAQLVFGNYGPMWYRGYFSDGLNQRALDNICAKYNAEQIVVGHTIVNDISTLFNKRIYAIDVKHSAKLEQNSGNALLIRNGNIHQVNAKGQLDEIRPLNTTNTMMVFKAIKENKPNELQRFLEGGHNINGYYSNEKFTLIHYAIKCGNISMLQLLIDKGANPNRFFGDKTALMFAIKTGSLSAVECLLKNGVDVNVENYRQKTALYYAAKYGDLYMAQMLVNAGAKLDHKDHKSRTPLAYAIENNNQPVVNYLKSLK
ncbi:MAG: ankyrin repeat domain-containing protein [Bacteroidota bacterium]